MLHVRLCLPALLMLVAGSPVSAQVLTGVLLEADSRAPIEGAMVVEAVRHRIRQVLSDEQRALFDQRVEAQGVLVPRDPD